MMQESTQNPHELVAVGDSVYWYVDGDRSSDPLPAVVTAKGHVGLCLNVMHHSTYNFVIRDGVRHISDPQAKRDELREQGAWDFTPRLKLLIALEREFMGVGKPVPAPQKKEEAKK